MKSKFALLFLAAASLAGCVKDPMFEENTPGTGGDAVVDASGDYYRGWVRIKLTEDAQPLKTGRFTRGAADTGDPELDRIASALGASEVRRTFTDGGRFAAARRAYGFHRWYDIRFDESVPVTRAQVDIAQLPWVESVAPIDRIHLEGVGTPYVPQYAPSSDFVIDDIRTEQSGEMFFNDPYLKKQWFLNNTGEMPGTAAGADVNAYGAWKKGYVGKPEVVVAVLDSGLDFNHPDLVNMLWTNEAELNGTSGVDDDGNGYVDDIHGADFMPHHPDIIIPGMHGNHVGGIIAAENNNGQGVCGVAGGSGKGDGVRLMSCQIVRDAVASDDIPMVEAFLYAAENGAVIANCSWTTERDRLSEETSTAIQYFIDLAGTDFDLPASGWDPTDPDFNPFDPNQWPEFDLSRVKQVGPMKGGIVICGAGNNGTNNVYYPAKDPRCVGVAAMYPDYSVAPYSEYGKGIDVLAPGGNKNDNPLQEYVKQYPQLASLQEMYSTGPVDKSPYYFQSGTSMACPVVSGVAGLIVSEFGGEGFTAKECRTILERSVRPFPAQVAEKYQGMVGKGLIDASLISRDLLQEPTGGPQEFPDDFKAEPTAASVTISFTVPLDGNGMPVVKYNFSWAEVVDGTPGKWTDQEIYNNAAKGQKFVHVFAGKSEADYTFSMNAVDRYGNQNSVREFDCSTLIFENRPPVLNPAFVDIELRDADEKYKRSYLLSQRFTDPDSVYGDVLTYEAESSDPRIVEVALTGGYGNTLELIPRAKGTVTITVRAKDTRDGVTETSFKCTVLKGPEVEPIVPDDPTPPVTPAETVGGLALSKAVVAAGDALTVTIDGAKGGNAELRVYDSAARRVGGCQLVVNENGAAEVPAGVVAAMVPGRNTVEVVYAGKTMRASVLKK